MMKLRDGLALGSLGLVSILFYFNCQKSHEAIQLKNSSFSSLMKKNDGQIPQLISYEANSPYSHQKVVIDFPALIESDEQFRVKNSQLLQDSNGTFSENSSDSIIIPAQTKLVALIDNDCALDKTDKMRDDAIDISQKVLSQNLQFIKEDMRVQTYSFVEDKDQSLSSLVQSADIDECLLGISQNAIYHTTSTVNDPSFDRQRHHNVIHTLDSWDTFYSPGIGIDRDVVVAVIDTGVDYLHPDLTNVMWKSDSGKFGRDFVNNDDDPMDDHFHGTHCAGLVGAQANNQIGVSGSMGYRAKIMAVKVLDSQGSGGIDAISNGVRWATDNGAEIISMSLGGPGKQATMEDALIYALSKGVVVLAAAGNDGRELTSTNFFSPGSYAKDNDGIISVGSFDVGTLSKSNFSNFSRSYVEIVSPGSDAANGNIYSTYPRSQNSYNGIAGTSMATPIAAGGAAMVVGILKSNGITVTASLVEEIMLKGAKKNSQFSNQFKDGNQLDLQWLAHYVSMRFLFDGNGGTEDSL